MKVKIYKAESEDEDDGKVYEEDDLVLCKMPDGSIRSCGFSINSLLLREGKSPMMTVNRGTSMSDSSSTGKVSDLFKHFAVPAGIFYTQPKNSCNKSTYINEEQDIEEELYEKLLQLASMHVANQNRGTRKHKIRKQGSKKNMKK
jgi:hypothetical protein